MPTKKEKRAKATSPKNGSGDDWGAPAKASSKKGGGPSAGVIGAAVVALGKALQSNTTLRNLTLYGNLGDAAGAALGEALRRNSALASLELRGHLRDKSGVALSEALKANTALRTLDLGFDLGEARGRLLGSLVSLGGRVRDISGGALVRLELDSRCAGA